MSTKQESIQQESDFERPANSESPAIKRTVIDPSSLRGKFGRFIGRPILTGAIWIQAVLSIGAILAAAGGLLIGGGEAMLWTGFVAGMMVASFLAGFRQNIRWSVVKPKVFASLSLLLSIPFGYWLIASGQGANITTAGILILVEVLVWLAAFSGASVGLSFREKEIDSLGGEDWYDQHSPFFPNGLCTFLFFGVGGFGAMVIGSLLFADALTQSAVGAPMEQLSVCNNVWVYDENCDPYEFETDARFCSITFFSSLKNQRYDDMKKIDQWREKLESNSNFHFQLCDMARVAPDQCIAKLDELGIQTKVIFGVTDHGAWVSPHWERPSTWVFDLETQTCVAAGLSGEKIDQVLQHASDRYAIAK